LFVSGRLRVVVGGEGGGFIFFAAFFQTAFFGIIEAV